MWHLAKLCQLIHKEAIFDELLNHHRDFGFVVHLLLLAALVTTIKIHKIKFACKYE